MKEPGSALGALIDAITTGDDPTKGNAGHLDKDRFGREMADIAKRVDRTDGPVAEHLMPYLDVATRIVTVGLDTDPNSNDRTTVASYMEKYGGGAPLQIMNALKGAAPAEGETRHESVQQINFYELGFGADTSQAAKQAYNKAVGRGMSPREAFITTVQVGLYGADWSLNAPQEARLGIYGGGDAGGLVALEAYLDDLTGR